MPKRWTSTTRILVICSVLAACGPSDEPPASAPKPGDSPASHPLADDAKGLRLRIETGQRCPSGDRGVVGVRNSGAGFDTALVPAEPPNGGQVCSYAGVDGQPFTLLAQRQLPAGQAARLAATAREMDLSPVQAGSACATSDHSAAVLVLTYPSRPATNLWLLTSGCSALYNGTIGTRDLAGLAILREAVDGVSG